MDIEKNYASFLRYIKAYITRDGVDNLVNWLEHSDIKVAPASTKYHMCCAGGLIQHSLNVFLRLIQLVNAEYPDEEKCPFTKETIALVALLHDIAKVNYYKIQFRNVKNDETGVWEKVQSYGIKDESERFAFSSHEENSLYMLSKFFKLSFEEELAIRFHMGPTDYSKAFDVSFAYERYSLPLLLHIADLSATYMDESEYHAELLAKLEADYLEKQESEGDEQEVVEDTETTVDETNAVQPVDSESPSVDTEAEEVDIADDTELDAEAPGASVFESDEIDDDCPF